MKAFVLDPPRCTGCEACRVACSIENRIPMARSWRTVHHVNPEHRPGSPAFHLSLACNHCAHPACLDACPASAYSKDTDTGAVLLDDSRCIGCRYCSWACPYDAPRFAADRGVMTKCTFCVDRLRGGQAPACGAACPTGALGVEELRANLSEPSFPGLFRGGLGPSLRIEEAAVPIAPVMAATCSADGSAWMGEDLKFPGKTSLHGEWTLWLFTLLAMTLVGLHLGWVLGGPRLLAAGPYLALGGLAAALSVFHLGRPERAWRALSNLRTSWLSREVLGFAVFLPTAVLTQERESGGAWIATAAGLFLLVAMDRLYQVVEHRPAWRLRSADLLPAGLQLAALVAGSLPALGVLAGIRAGLYVFAAIRQSRRKPDPALAVARMAALVLQVLALGAGASIWIPLACFLAGEALDRTEFYNGLDIPSPASLLDSRAASVTSGSADPA